MSKSLTGPRCYRIAQLCNQHGMNVVASDVSDAYDAYSPIVSTWLLMTDLRQPSTWELMSASHPCDRQRALADKHLSPEWPAFETLARTEILLVSEKRKALVAFHSSKSTTTMRARIAELWLKLRQEYYDQQSKHFELTVFPSAYEFISLPTMAGLIEMGSVARKRSARDPKSAFSQAQLRSIESDLEAYSASAIDKLTGSLQSRMGGRRRTFAEIVDDPAVLINCAAWSNHVYDYGGKLFTIAALMTQDCGHPQIHAPFPAKLEVGFSTSKYLEEACGVPNVSWPKRVKTFGYSFDTTVAYAQKLLAKIEENSLVTPDSMTALNGMGLSFVCLDCRDNSPPGMVLDLQDKDKHYSFIEMVSPCCEMARLQ